MTVGPAASGMDGRLRTLLARHICQLREVRLDGAGLGADDMLAVAAGLRARGGVVKVLHLDQNVIGDRGAARLAHALGEGAARSLQKIDLGGNAIGAEGCRHVAACLEQAGLRLLCLDKNPIGPQGAQALASVLPKCPALKALLVAGCKIDDGGAIALVRARLTSSSDLALSHLDLSENRIGDTFLQALTELFDSLPNDEVGRKPGETHVMTIHLGGIDFSPDIQEPAEAAASRAGVLLRVGKIEREIRPPPGALVEELQSIVRSQQAQVADVLSSRAPRQFQSGSLWAAGILESLYVPKHPSGQSIVLIESSCSTALNDPRTHAPINAHILYLVARECDAVEVLGEALAKGASDETFEHLSTGRAHHAGDSFVIVRVQRWALTESKPPPSRGAKRPRA